MRARQRDAADRTAVSLLDAARQEVSVAQPAQRPRLVLDRVALSREMPRRLMLGKAGLRPAERVVDVAAHVMDAGQLQAVLLLVRDGARCRAPPALRCGGRQSAARRPSVMRSASSSRVRSLLRGILRQRREPLRAMRHRLLVGVARAGALGGFVPVPRRALELAGLHGVIGQHLGRRRDRVAGLGQRLGDLRVVLLPLALQQAFIGGVPHHGVLERIACALRDGPVRNNRPAASSWRSAASSVDFLGCEHGGEQITRKLPADAGADLRHLAHRRGAVETRHQAVADRRGDRQLRRACRQADRHRRFR